MPSLARERAGCGLVSALSPELMELFSIIYEPQLGSLPSIDLLEVSVSFKSNCCRFSQPLALVCGKTWGSEASAQMTLCWICPHLSGTILCLPLLALGSWKAHLWGCIVQAPLLPVRPRRLPAKGRAGGQRGWGLSTLVPLSLYGARAGSSFLLLLASGCLLIPLWFPLQFPNLPQTFENNLSINFFSVKFF